MFILDENTLSESLSSFFLHFVQLYYDFLLMLNDLVYDLYRTKPIKQKSTILLNTGIKILPRSLVLHLYISG